MMAEAWEKDTGRTIPEMFQGETKSRVSAALQPGGE